MLRRPEPDGAILWAVSQLRRPQTRVAEVSTRIGRGSRWFTDRFARVVGLTPKVFSRVQRFQSALRRIHRGESVGIVGATGVGKSTVVDLIVGLLEPTAGRLTVDGVDIRTHLASWQRQIGYVPQSVFLIDDTLLYENGVRDFDRYRVDPTMPLALDLYIPEDAPLPPTVTLGPLPD